MHGRGAAVCCAAPTTKLIADDSAFGQQRNPGPRSANLGLGMPDIKLFQYACMDVTADFQDGAPAYYWSG